MTASVPDRAQSDGVRVVVYVAGSCATFDVPTVGEHGASGSAGGVHAAAVEAVTAFIRANRVERVEIMW